MSPVSSDFGREVIGLLDAANGALARNDRSEAALNYARASELLFQRAGQATSAATKVELGKRAQQLLHTARHLRGESVEIEEAMDAPSTAALPLKTGITFDEIAGLDEVKETLRLRVIYPLMHPEKLAKFGLRAGGGLLLYGPPGTGKTMIAKAVSNELSLPFFAIKPSEVLSKFVGESEQKLAALFEEARSNSRGAVVFVDEIDAIGASRESTSNDAARRLLTQLLQELDGVQGRDSGLLFLAATNEPWLLDAALLRPGRFDEKCYVPLPDELARLVLLQLQLRDCELSVDLDLTSIAQSTDGYSGADLMCLCERAKQIPFREAVLNGTDRSLNAADFETASKHIRPSITQQLLQRFESYAFE